MVFSFTGHQRNEDENYDYFIIFSQNLSHQERTSDGRILTPHSVVTSTEVSRLSLQSKSTHHRGIVAPFTGTNPGVYADKDPIYINLNETVDSTREKVRTVCFLSFRVPRFIVT